MANSRAFLDAEEWVRSTGLASKFPGVEFSKVKLKIGIKNDGSLAVHEFDAVSDDRTIVVSVKGGSGRTSGGRSPVGQIRDAYVESLFLSRADATRRILVMTEHRLFQEFDRVSEGKRPENVELMHIALPADLADQVRVARGNARVEMGAPPHDHRIAR